MSLVRRQVGAQRLQSLHSFTAIAALYEMLFELDLSNDVQFPVNEGMYQTLNVLTVHNAPPFSKFVVSRFSSCARPRLSRDITVPTGTSVTEAIS